MPNIPWDVGEEATINAAKYAGERKLHALSQWGDIAGTGIRLYQDQKKTDEEIEQQRALAEQYDKLEGQNADQLRQQEQERKPVSSTSVSKVAEAAEEDPSLGGFSKGISTPGDYSTKDGDIQSAGVSTPGAAAQDVQTSKQQPGSKPATPTQQGATSETDPPPATKVASADDSTKALHKVATSPKNVGSFVTGAAETVGDAAKGAYHAVGNLGGGRFWQRLGNIVGMEDPERQGKLLDLARFNGRALLRSEQDKRAASLSGLAATMAKPMEAIQGIAPYPLRNMPEGLRNAPTAAADKANKNPNMWRVLYEAAGGDKNPNSWVLAQQSYEKLQTRLAKARRGGQTTEQFIRDLMFGDAADQAAGREYARFAAENGLTKAPIETTQQKMDATTGEGQGTTKPIDYGTMRGRGTETGAGATPAAGAGAGPSPLGNMAHGGAIRGNADVTRLPALAFDNRWKKAETQYQTPPNLVRAMAWQESGFRPGATGIEHEKYGTPLGLGQFMSKSTALRFGITPENYQDVDKQIAAMNQYMVELYKEQIAKGDDSMTAWRRAAQRYHGIGPDKLGVTHTQYWQQLSQKWAALDAMEHGGGSPTQQVQGQEAGAAAAATPPPHPQTPAGPSTSQPVGPSTTTSTTLPPPAAGAQPGAQPGKKPPRSPRLHPLLPGQVRVEPLPETTTTTPTTSTTSTTQATGGVDPKIWQLYYEQALQLPEGQFPPWHPLGEGGLPTTPPYMPPTGAGWSGTAFPPPPSFNSLGNATPSPGGRPLANLAAGVS